MRYLFLLLLSLPLFSATLELFDTQKTTTEGFTTVVHDPNAIYSHQDIFTGNYTNATTSTRTSYTDKTLWTKSTILNKSDETLPLIFRNLKAGINEIDVFIYQEGSLITSHHLGNMRDIKERELSATKSIFYHALAPYEEMTLIVKYKSIGTLELLWEIYNPREYSYLNSLELLFWGLFGGIVFALIIYNGSIYLSLRDPTFIYYILHAFMVLLFNYSMSGVFFLMDIGINRELLSISTWQTPMLMLLFLVLFTMSFFRLKECSPLLYNYSRVLALSLVVSFISTLLLYYDSSFARYTNLTILHSLFTLVSIFAIALWALYRRLSGAVYFFIGESIYVGALIYTISIMAGDTQQSLLGMLIVPSAIIVEMVLLSLALSFKIKKIYEESEKSKLLLRQQSESQKLGRVVSSISHQWRQPLSLISSEIMYLLLLEKKGKRESITDEFLKNAPKLQNSINYMSQTLNLFTNFYKPHAQREEFALKESLSTLKVLTHHELTLNNISFSIECEESLRVTTDKASLLNIVMIFLENAIYELSHSSTEDKEIQIVVSQEQESIKLLFMDNAQNRRINSNNIFELESNESKNSSGLGLKIAKELAHAKLGAKIGAYTKESWSIFWLEYSSTN